MHRLTREMNARELAEVLVMAKKVCDEEWEKLGPEKRKRICENLLKRAEARIKKKGEQK